MRPSTLGINDIDSASLFMVELPVRLNQHSMGFAVIAGGNGAKHGEVHAG
ncbi:hypothetical protein [Undibacterium aquatile]|uniref:Uncharacterized protein n=1 Tax=Undibacterium aquatile TaxID=1537398 RepID=A0ABR6XC04_9BURK|nr:hypothetical protein [Undibacterium aquatile]MBC3810100.1 hypothetical protein [Undibacterium aquatile]